jgi:hypothetical protein
MSFRQTAVRVFAVGLTVALSWSMWAACADAPALTANSQMACCKDGELACAPNGNAADCCNTGAARSQVAVTAATVKPLHQPVAVVVAWGVLQEVPAFSLARIRARESALPQRIDPGPPPYIAFSSLLI